MDLELKDKTAVVTGGSKGIGLAVAQALIAEGARVTLVARDEATLEQAQAELGGDVAIVSADLGSEDGRAQLVTKTGTPDIWVNNAGAIPAGGLADLTTADWRTGWELKLFGYIDLCRMIYPAMAQRRAGTILNIIGMAGRANRAAYIYGSTANAGLIAFTNALGAEAQSCGVRVLGINPPLTLTDRMGRFLEGKAKTLFGDASRWREAIDPADYPYGRPAAPEEIGALAAMLCAPQVQYLNGSVIDIDGGGQWGAP